VKIGLSKDSEIYSYNVLEREQANKREIVRVLIWKNGTSGLERERRGGVDGGKVELDVKAICPYTAIDGT
jgi:hypothetical protein